MVVYSMLRALRSTGTLLDNHSLNGRRQEQSVIRQEAAEVNDQEMETQKSSNSVRSGFAKGRGACSDASEEASPRA